jgi:UDP-N-acetylmuramate--alanine ligase
VVTNVEADHLDFYGGLEEIERTFAAFVENARTVVACWDDPGVRRALDRRRSAVIRYGSEEGVDLRVDDISVGFPGSTAILRFGGESARVILNVPGRHNALNAAGAVGAAVMLGVPLTEAADALGTFTGVRRRFEVRGEVDGAVFVDDYAHHPTEVAATLIAARGGEHRRLVAVFQPHRYTRTRAMWRALGESLSNADVVVLTDVYPAGEAPIPGVTGKLVAAALAEASPGKRVVYLPRRSEVSDFLAAEVRSGDLVLTLGAGDITMTADEAIERIRRGAA